MATPRCRVCAHPDRTAIDLALVRGDSHRTVVDRFNLAKSSVTRHAKHSRAVVRATNAADVNHERTVLAGVKEMQAAALAVFEAVKYETEGLSPLDAIREVARLLDQEAKLTGAYAPKEITLKLDSLSDEELEAKYLAALERGQKDTNARSGEPS